MEHSHVVLNFQDFIDAESGQLTTTSLQVAAVFGKQHGHVMHAIRLLLSELPEGYHSNFGETEEARASPLNGAPISTPMYTMTRYGFTLLVMGFTGKKALAFKLAYLDAFDAMEAFIRNQAIGIRYRLDEALLAEKDSKRRASLHGRGLRERRSEAPVLNAAITTLRTKLEPMLPMFDEVAGPIH